MDFGWGAALGGIVGGAAGIAGLFDDSGEVAADAMNAAMAKMEKRLDTAISDVEGEVDTYFQTLDEIQAGFDPYDMSQAFSSLYEGVIKPMEIEYEEYIVPSIKAAYSGGVAGASAAQSGASKEAELKARQRLSTSKGQLLAQERSDAIGRNIALRGMEEQTAKDRLTAGTIAPQMSANAASSIFGAEQAAIETQYAADRSAFESLLSIPSSITSGTQAGGSLQDMLTKK